MGEPREHDIRMIASEIASVKTMVDQWANDDLRALSKMLDMAMDEALFQARLAHEAERSK